MGRACGCHVMDLFDCCCLFLSFLRHLLFYFTDSGLEEAAIGCLLGDGWDFIDVWLVSSHATTFRIKGTLMERLLLKLL
jgi:hypothetical protein